MVDVELIGSRLPWSGAKIEDLPKRNPPILGPCTVIGGGSTKALGPGTQISCNQHGLKLGRCDYVVCLDNIQDKLACYRHEATIVTRAENGFGDETFPEGMIAYPLTGLAALWWAWWKGFDPIHITGMTFYQDDPSYWTSDEKRLDLLKRHTRWWKTTIALCEGAEITGLDL